MSIITDKDGKSSSKRTMGIIIVITMLILFVYKEFLDKTITNPEIFIGMLVTGGSLLGIAVFEYFAQVKK